MVSADDVAELILEAVRESARVPRNFRKSLEKEPARQGKWGSFSRGDYNRPYTSLPARKIFLSEHDLKKMLKAGCGVLRVPKASILSPLAQEWIETRRIRVEFIEP